MKTIEWIEGRLRLIDQTKLPQKETFLELSDYREVVKAIREMKVRGAPAIGVAAAYGIALGAQQIKATTKQKVLQGLKQICQSFSATRPTAVNLFKAVEQMTKVAEDRELNEIRSALPA